ncbi:FMN-binding negative transcriptional regulator [Hyphomonas pacifica]|uniref:FMN-binding negative transcriptional regulator n=1 Tax=Hyphomonas pacifica TaxID=1280941 RepID=UPI000DBFCECA|nr:FMN-binding negative transcriptional regulator [Hyphomonas pacifica]RAN35927.1 hypothetical protein HY11_13170 [Hyphomonas pacifica]
MTVSPARPIGTDAMHPSRVFHEHDRALLLETARQNAFALIISSLNNRPIAAHAPVLLDEAGADIHLRFHLANANPATEALKQTGQTLVVFTGPHAYVSPDWYGQPDQVGTWNYISVEAEGPVTPLTADAPPGCWTIFPPCTRANLPQSPPGHGTRWTPQSSPACSLPSPASS